MSPAPEEQSFGDATQAAADSTTEIGMVRSEERLRISNQRSPIGKAVLRKVIVVEQRTITVEVAHEEVRLEYVPFADENRDAVKLSHLALPEIVLHEEQLVITKRTVPTERVRATIVNVPGEYELTEDVRHEEIELTSSARASHLREMNSD